MTVEQFAEFWNVVNLQGIATKLQAFTVVGDCHEWDGSRDHKNYGCVTLGSHPFRAHRAVLALATGECPPRLEAAHSCHNPPCINRMHLSWQTTLGNRYQSLAVGRGSGNVKPKLRVQQIPEIRLLIARGSTIAEIATKYGVSKAAIFGIRAGRYWAWVA